MSQAALSSPHKAEYTLTVMNGSDKGAVYRLIASEITLGRSSENDIAFPEDPGCSRRHAKITFTGEHYEIENLSDKNSLFVNGQNIRSQRLGNDDQIGLGSVILKFQYSNSPVPVPTAVKPAPHLQTVPDRGISPADRGVTQANYAAPRHRRKPQSSLLTPPRIIIGVVLLGFAYLMMGDPPAGKKEVQLRTNEQIEADIETANKLKEVALLERQKGQTHTQTYQEAQAAYLRGFRDYQQGVYGRAIESFQACLSLLPDHTLCQRYLRLGQRKFSELIQQHMVLGRNYRDQNQFAACASAFSSVMIKVRDPNNKIYKEAKANYDACRTQVEGQF